MSELFNKLGYKFGQLIVYMMYGYFLYTLSISLFAYAGIPEFSFGECVIMAIFLESEYKKRKAIKFNKED